MKRSGEEGSIAGGVGSSTISTTAMISESGRTSSAKADSASSEILVFTFVINALPRSAQRA